MSETDTKTQLLINFKWLHMASIWIQMGSRCNSYGSIWDPDVIHMDPYGIYLGSKWIHQGVIWIHMGARWDPYEIQMDPSGIHLDPNGIQL